MICDGVQNGEVMMVENKMLLKIESFMHEYQMLPDGAGVIIGVSGGADSVALLKALRHLSLYHEWKLYAVHVHHGLRGKAADEDAAFVLALCASMDVPCTVYRTDIRALARERRLSEEEAGREYRYQCFEEVRQLMGADKIAVAHHGDDAAETFLLNLFRGTGLQGLTGIQAVRDRIIRPMLAVSRSEIETWLKTQDMAWRTDATNLETHYARNKIRNVVLPYVTDEINAGAVRHIREAAERLERIRHYLEKETERVQQLYVHDLSDGNTDAVIDLALFEKEDPVICEEVLRNVIGQCAGSRKDITARHIQAVTALTLQQTGRRLDLPYGLKVIRSYDTLIMTKDHVRSGPGAEEIFEVQVPGRIVLPDGKVLVFSTFKRSRIMSEIPVNQCTKWFDYAKMMDGFVVRHKLPGDYLIIDSDGHKKLLKKWLKDEKIPAARREALWVIACGSHIVWILGYRISAYYKVEQSADQVLSITLKV